MCQLCAAAGYNLHSGGGAPAGEDVTMTLVMADVTSAAPVFNLTQITNQLRTQWGGAQEGTYRAFFGSNVTYSIADYYPTNAPYGEDQAYTMSPVMKAIARLGFELWDDAIAINLNESVNNPAANITMNWANLTYNGSGVLSTGGGTYARPTLGAYSGGYYQITAQQIWLNMNWSSHDQDSDMYYGGYGVATFVHEIGHTLGLSHPGTYNAGNNPVTYAANAEFAQDNREFTIMSYFGGYNPNTNSWTTDGTSSSWYYPSTPMVYDIAAIQATYGADYTTRAGNSTYGFNITGDVAARSANGLAVYSFAQNAHPIFTIWDGGGYDMLDCSGYGANQYIDLIAGDYSSIGGMNGNIGIAYGCTIESAIGGYGGDTMIANGLGCWMAGVAGNDTMYGGAGNDTLIGGTGIDVLSGGAGADTYVFATGDSSAATGQHDRINGFVSGLDRIDLTGIDAVAATGVRDQFRFLGAAGFDGAAGALAYVYNPVLGVTILQGDTNGDGIADFAIDLAGNITLAVADIIGATATAPVPTTTIEAFGSTSLVQIGNNYQLRNIATGTGPTLTSGNGTPFAAGQAGNWLPIGVEQTATGYQVAWRGIGTDQYSVWATDSNGIYTGNVIGVVSGNSPTWSSFENSFHQDLNGNGVIGAAGPTTVIEASGSTSLLQVGSNYLLNNITTGTGPSLTSGNGTLFAAGQAGNWLPIGVEQTATGYQVAWRGIGTDQYSIWATDSNGVYISNVIGVVSGTSGVWSSFENSFHQDLNGDGAIGVPGAIESFGSTSLVQVGSNYFLNNIATGTGPSLNNGNGTLFAAGQAGNWLPIAVEQTSTGYQVAWRGMGTDQYSVWATDSNGVYISNVIGVVSGSSATWKSFEASFHQDLNGDGAIGGAPLDSAVTGPGNFAWVNDPTGIAASVSPAYQPSSNAGQGPFEHSFRFADIPTDLKISQGEFAVSEFYPALTDKGGAAAFHDAPQPGAGFWHDDSSAISFAVKDQIADAHHDWHI